MGAFEGTGTVDFQRCIEHCSAHGGCFPIHPSCNEANEIRMPDFRETCFSISGNQIANLFESLLSNT